jgi:hypothetical protein
MGITGLFQILNKIKNKDHISSYKDKKIAIDAFCWLHRSTCLLKNLQLSGIFILIKETIKIT